MHYMKTEEDNLTRILGFCNMAWKHAVLVPNRVPKWSKETTAIHYTARYTPP